MRIIRGVAQDDLERDEDVGVRVNGFFPTFPSLVNDPSADSASLPTIRLKPRTTNPDDGRNCHAGSHNCPSAMLIPIRPRPIRPPQAQTLIVILGEAILGTQMLKQCLMQYCNLKNA